MRTQSAESVLAAQRKHAGFTLIELMVAVAVVGILAAIAYPSYTGYVTRTNRANGAGCLQQLAQWMERNYTTCLRYDRTGATCATTVGSAQLPALACRTELGTRYAFTVATTPAIGANVYRLEATPGGAQAGDTACGTLSINQAGVKGATGPSGAEGCWR